MNGGILVIGIDGGTWHILNPAIEAGYLPFIEKVVEGGASGVLESTLPAITPAAWSSFQTGSNPGRTGIVDFTRWNRKSGRSELVSSRLLPLTLWEAAGNAGHTVGVLNLPMTYPPRPVEGFMISGLMAPSLESDFIYPPLLKPDLLAAVPDYYLFNLETAVADSLRGSVEALTEWAAGIVECRSRAAGYLTGRYRPELCMVHFQASDPVQHILWPFLDRGHDMFDEAKWHGIMRGFYAVLDTEIRSIFETFQEINREPVTVMIISDHGFQLHMRRFNLWNWTMREGYLHVDPGRIDMPHPGDSSPVDLERSRVLPTGRSNEAFLYLLEEPGPGRLATAESIRSGLTSLLDPVNGRRVVKAVHFREDIYTGPELDRIPDLIIEPADTYSVTGVYEADPELFRTVVPGEDFHLGRHHSHGMVAASGPDILPQKNLYCRLIDIAPTLLHCLGAPIPAGMDGCVVEELFTTSGPSHESRESSPTEIDLDAGTGGGSENEVYSDEERELIEQRLRDLGYL